MYKRNTSSNRDLKITRKQLCKPSQAEVPDGSKYVQTVPDGKYLCPDRPRRKLPMSRLSCVRQNFVRSCPDFRAFTRLWRVHVQTFVRSPDFRAFMSTLPCVHQTFVRSTDFRAFMSRLSRVHQTFVSSTDFCAFMSRISCVRQTFLRLCPDFCAFTQFSYVQPIFERSCPDFRAFMSRLLSLRQS